MTLFWILSAAMIAVALALLAPTLLRRHAVGGGGNRQFNVEIAREHLAELSRQKESGELSDEEFAQARKDIELALAEDLEGGAETAPVAHAGGRWALPVAVVLVPLISIPLYLAIGSPHLIEGQLVQPKMAAPHGAQGGQGGQREMPSMDKLVVQLRQKMEANPQNAEGWYLLGRTYMRLKDYPNSVFAFEKVVGLLPNEPAALVSLADALAMREGRTVGPRSVELLRKALSFDPNNITALWLLGKGAADRGDNATALKHWNRAYPLLDKNPGMKAELGQLITRAGGTPPSTPGALPPIMTAAAPAATQAPRAQRPTAEAGDGAAITVEVALSPHLMEKTAPTDTLFVLARAESGPPMPLAVSRHQVSELPLTVTLTDAMAMMPAMRLSAFPRVKISAKVSKSGQAGTKPGDLLASDVVVDSGNNSDSVQLLINRVAE